MLGRKLRWKSHTLKRCLSSKDTPIVQIMNVDIELPLQFIELYKSSIAHQNLLMYIALKVLLICRPSS